MRQLRARLSYANVIATIALFIALGGGAYAATQLPKNSIGSKQIKPGSIQLNDLNKAARTKLKGAPGAPGATGSFSSTLPSGQTLRGVFNFDAEVATGGDLIGGSISFGAQLSRPPAIQVIPVDGAPTGNCPGSVKNPTAAPGVLCVYLVSRSKSVGDFSLCDVGCESATFASPWGVEVFVTSKEKGRIFADGSWAVTAP